MSAISARTMRAFMWGNLLMIVKLGLMVTGLSREEYGPNSGRPNIFICGLSFLVLSIVYQSLIILSPGHIFVTLSILCYDVIIAKIENPINRPFIERFSTVLAPILIVIDKYYHFVKFGVILMTSSTP